MGESLLLDRVQAEWDCKFYKLGRSILVMSEVSDGVCDSRCTRCIVSSYDQYVAQFIENYNIGGRFVPHLSYLHLDVLGVFRSVSCIYIEQCIIYNVVERPLVHGSSSESVTRTQNAHFVS